MKIWRKINWTKVVITLLAIAFGGLLYVAFMGAASYLVDWAHIEHP